MAITYVDGAAVEASSGRMLLTLMSGGDKLQFHIPAHIALTLRHTIMRDGWQVHCAPNAETVSLAAVRARKRREKKQG
jgi:hypothetical protein